ncbi:hypothetical protein [Bradyrhizobium sp. AZCC 1614]
MTRSKNSPRLPENATGIGGGTGKGCGGGTCGGQLIWFMVQLQRER